MDRQVVVKYGASMVTFLFWNLNRQPIPHLVAQLAHQHAVDILMLAECVFAPAELLQRLNATFINYHYASADSFCERIKIFTRFSPKFIRKKEEDNYTTIRHLELPEKPDILLAVSHLRSKLHATEHDQLRNCERLAGQIRYVEKQIGHQKTVLVGDFNANPFETAMISARSLHTVMTRQIAQKGTRKILGQEYPFFYNPMWGVWGDNNLEQHPPGTYYWTKNLDVEFFWHMFDQVLIRPALLNYFDNRNLQILRTAGEVSLVTKNGLPDKSKSDHLPLLFKLNF